MTDLATAVIIAHEHEKTACSIAHTQNTDLIADFITVHGKYGHIRKLSIKKPYTILYEDLRAAYTPSFYATNT